MKIDKVTITGADDRTTYVDLLNLQEDFPFVEWGILFSESKEGQSRYPSSDHRASHFAVGKLVLSAHFCGWWARQILEECNYHLISYLPPQYRRIQLNYNFSNSRNFNLKKLERFMYDTDRRIILQYNRSNQPAIDQFLRENAVSSKIHFLYDASGGNGIGIKNIESPIGGHYTGYAGGINFDTIDSVCCDVKRLPDTTSAWIDLESGCRTEDKFDVELTRMILKKAEYHIER